MSALRFARIAARNNTVRGSDNFGLAMQSEMHRACLPRDVAAARVIARYRPNPNMSNLRKAAVQ